MSTPPPPPPPMTGYPSSRARAAWTKQEQRAQQRMAVAMARQQRATLRMQKRNNRRSSLVGPVLLTSLGAWLFVVQMGRVSWSTALDWFSRGWPFLLLTAGLVLIAEWYIDTQRARASGEPTSRRVLGAGAGFLLFCVAAFGIGSAPLQRHALTVLNQWNSGQSWGLTDLLAQRTEAVEQLQAPLMTGATLTVKNYHGNVTVTGSSQDGLVHVTARRHLQSWKGDELERRKKEGAPTLTSTASGLELLAPGEGHDDTELSIEVPHEAGLVLEPTQGELSVSELRGPVRVGQHDGNIILAALTGDVLLAVRDDDASVSGHSLTGTLALEGRSGDLTFTDVNGPLTLKGDFFGTTHLERIQGPVHFQSSFTDLTCAKISGELNVEGRNELSGRDLDGPVVLTTTDRNVSLTEIHRGITVRDQKASVSLGLADLDHGIEVSTTDGPISLVLPRKSQFEVRAETADGQISNDFGLRANTNEDRVSLEGKIGGQGSMIQLQTTEGDIRLLKSGVFHKDLSEEANTE